MQSNSGPLESAVSRSPTLLQSFGDCILLLLAAERASIMMRKKGAFLDLGPVILAIVLALVLSVFSAKPAQTSKPSVPRFYRQVEVYVTARDTKDRLTPRDPLKFDALAQPDEANPMIMLDASKTYQAIEGFGGALTDAAAETFYRLPENLRREVLNAYFNPETGIGYTLCRTHINSCDFSSSSYSYDDVPGDVKLERFSIEPDRKYRVPFIREALTVAKNGFKLFASPWSPPAWMKTNNNMLHGGALKPECRQAWAEYFARFIQAYQKEGIPVWGVTVQNEPMAVQRWESCIYSAYDERDFVRDHLGPALAKAGSSKVAIIVWDHNRGIMYQRAKAIYDDPAASKYVWGMGFHWYVGDHFDNVRWVHEAYPDKKLLFTEGTPASFNPKRLGEWQYGETYARSMINDLNNWAVGWVDWNVVVDERGGPNHVGNFCVAPIIGDTTNGTVTYMNSYYYIGHFSKFIRPGAKRIICSSNQDDLLATAFVNPNGSIAVVVMNQRDRAREFKVWIDGKAATTNSPGHSILTLILKP
jgi:glucosylceramidase